MPKQIKPDKPVILGNTPSANWKKFLAVNGSSKVEKKKKFNVRREVKPDLSLIHKDDSVSKLLERMPETVAIDCEMVGVSSPMRDMLARVSIVNMDGECIYDKYVLATEEVLDYRTKVSGIRPHDLKKGEPYDTVREEVATLLNNKIVVGHAVNNDFNVLKIKHPKFLIRDTSHFPVFVGMFNGKTPSLRNLSRVVLGVNIQSGEHSSVYDAKAALQLYMVYRREWEEFISKKSSKLHRNSKRKR